MNHADAMTWLDDPAYRWIREHLWHRPGDRLVYTVQASGYPERPEPPPVLGEEACPLEALIMEHMQHRARCVDRALARLCMHGPYRLEDLELMELRSRAQEYPQWPQFLIRAKAEPLPLRAQGIPG